ncbi:hypothetical protein [Corallococcus coralloides]|uniref:hypothetical protein n=1 Tax=Corallococcus coralloides TaxID=184914 RepID=UPI0011D1AF7A|nr:hypothetical protein [Corallococcus coralloides]
MSKAIGDQDKLFFEAGKKHFRIWTAVNGKPTDAIDWFTVEKLLFEHWRGEIQIHGLTSHREFLKFQLLYVGISKQDDSFSRLFQNGHEKRTKILSNETQKRAAARLTDELFIFFFDVQQTHVRTIEDADDVDRVFEEPYVDKARLVADAEKAFVKILDTSYNTIKYKQYPKGVDGLHGAGLDAYVYWIDEDVEFTTSSETVRGAHVGDGMNPMSADVILISGDKVSLVKPDTAED